MNSAVLNRSRGKRILATVSVGVIALVFAGEPVGALDVKGKLSAQAPAASVSQSHRLARKRRDPIHRRPVVRYGRHLYPYPYYPPCPYYFPAYGTFPCFAQGYYPDPPYSYGFGFGGPFWGGGIFDHD